MFTGGQLAHAQTNVVEKLKQVKTFVWGYDNRPFDTVEQAFADYLARGLTSCNTAGYTCYADNLQVCPNQANYMWGEPIEWCWHFVRKLYGNLDYEGIVGSIAQNWGCPTTPYYTPVTNLVSGTGTAGDPRYYENRCELVKPPVLPKECGKGNPIYPESGTKRQVELDYASARGTLTFSRNYDSSYGRFRSEYEVDFLSPDLKLGSACVAGEYSYVDSNSNTMLRYQRCFPTLNTDVGSKGVLVSGDGTRDDLAWNGTLGTSTAPYFKNRLVRFTVDGASGWLMTRAEENRFLAFDALGRLLFVQRVDGSRVTLGYGADGLSAVADDVGRTLQVTRGPNGISGFIDPAGRAVSYTHADVNKISSVTYQDGMSRIYTWDETAWSTGSPPSVNRLTGLIDESGKQFASFGYAYGKAVSTEYAGGVNRYSVSDARSGGYGNIAITYPNGAVYTSSYGLYNGYSRVTSNNQPAGSGCSAASSQATYDANGNRASVDDFNGKRACYSNDLSRNLEMTRVEGLSNTQACSAVTGAGATIPAGSRKVSTTWHPDWRLQTKLAEPGRLTTSIYNGQPDPFNANAIANCAPSSALLPDGKPIAVLCKQVEQASTDADGSQGFSASLQTGVANRVRTWTYNQYGQVLSEKDPLNNTTTYAYYTDTSFTGADPNAVGHRLGDLQSVTNAQNQVTSYAKYDKHGNVLESTDANGVVTSNTYDLRQRLLSTSVGGQTTSYEYDPVGQLLKVTGPDQSWIGYEYDAAHRQTAVKDSLGNRNEYVLDNAGNRTGQSVKDPGGSLARSLAQSIDALGRVQQTSGRQ